MTTINALNERIINLQDKQIKDLEKARELDKELHAAELKQAVARVAAERDFYKAAFEAQLHTAEVAEGQKDQAVKKLETLAGQVESLEEDIRNWSTAYDTLNKSLGNHMELAVAFVDNICEMVACDAELSDIAEECMQWCRGEWAPITEQQEEDVVVRPCCGGGPSDVYKWKVLVVEHQDDEAVFTGFYANYDLARESVDLMVARGCYEAWVEELL